MPHQQFQSCIDACNDCAVACDHCAASCLNEKDVKAMARCIRLDMDCAALCRLAAGYMARGSELAGMICETCADVCDACAQECEKHSMDHCRECAQACRRCAEECRRMASTLSGGHAQPRARAHA
ncbi:MAG TPA: four-helix bundle copper-binding protein [Burkholderiales bacterium]